MLQRGTTPSKMCCYRILQHTIIQIHSLYPYELKNDKEIKTRMNYENCFGDCTQNLCPTLIKKLT